MAGRWSRLFFANRPHLCWSLARCFTTHARLGHLGRFCLPRRLPARVPRGRRAPCEAPAVAPAKAPSRHPRPRGRGGRTQTALNDCWFTVAAGRPFAGTLAPWHSPKPQSPLGPRAGLCSRVRPAARRMVRMPPLRSPMGDLVFDRGLACLYAARSGHDERRSAASTHRRVGNAELTRSPGRRQVVAQSLQHTRALGAWPKPTELPGIRLDGLAR